MSWLTETEALTAARAMSGSAPHFTYRITDAEGVVLYVGETNNVQRRLGEHRRRAGWWPRAEQVTYREHPNPHEARLTERAWIREFSPTCNSIRYVDPTPTEREMESEAAVSEAMFAMIMGGLS